MLLKSTAAVPHQGGQVLKPGTPYYEQVRNWIAAGAHLNLTSPRVTRLEISPANPVVEAIGARQQIRVVAIYSDGSQRDVTREAFVESGNTDVVKTVPEQPGLLEALRRGEAAALVRYEGNYAATTLTVMGDRTGFAWEEPPANNRIDELVAAKLKRTKTLPSAASRTTTNSFAACTSTSPACRRRRNKFKRSSTMRATRAPSATRSSTQLIGSDDYIEYWTNKWADLLMVNRKFLGVEGATAMRNWIRGQLGEQHAVRPVRARDPHRHRLDEGEPGRLAISRRSARRRR